jgi:hypothetical protein
MTNGCDSGVTMAGNRGVRDTGYKQSHCNRRTRRAWTQFSREFSDRLMDEWQLDPSKSVGSPEIVAFMNLKKARAVYLTNEHRRRKAVRETKTREGAMPEHEVWGMN